MAHTHHVETHFTAGESVRDVVIGMSDGLTVPFALAAGLTGTAAASAHLIVAAGLAEIAAGSIAMGLGGYLAAKSDAEHYDSELKREAEEVERVPEVERAEVAEVFLAYGLTHEQVEPILDALQAKPKDWIEFMMKFELGLEKPNPKRALDKRSNHRGVLHRRRFDPAFPLYDDQRAKVGAVLVGGRDALFAGGLRIHQRPVHWDSPAARSDANDARRRHCSRRGVYARGLVRLI